MKIKSLVLSLTVLLAGVLVEAQTCLNTVNLSSICGPYSARVVSGVCKNGVSKIYGSPSSSCLPASTIMNQLNAICNSSGNCPAPPPPPPPAPAPMPVPPPAPVPPPPPPAGSIYTLVSNYKTKVVSGSLVNVNFERNVHNGSRDCLYIKNKHNFAVNSTDRRNSAFLALAASGQYLTVSLSCPSAPVVQVNNSTIYESSGYGGNYIVQTNTYTYASGCFVVSFVATPTPPAPRCIIP